MPLFRIVVGLLVFGVAVAVLSLVLNVLKAILIVGAIGLALGVALSLRRSPKKRLPPGRAE